MCSSSTIRYTGNKAHNFFSDCVRDADSVRRNPNRITNRDDAPPAA
ncbi:MAG TPA: hypothetical protein P5526_09835 [Anaerolineae bacterium]|nr:hypothetical protein [Anaerolineae bacterium]